jgi:hypothetical protein
MRCKQLGGRSRSSSRCRGTTIPTSSSPATTPPTRRIGPRRKSLSCRSRPTNHHPPGSRGKASTRRTISLPGPSLSALTLLLPRSTSPTLLDLKAQPPTIASTLPKRPTLLIPSAKPPNTSPPPHLSRDRPTTKSRLLHTKLTLFAPKPIPAVVTPQTLQNSREIAAIGKYLFA